MRPRAVGVLAVVCAFAIGSCGVPDAGTTTPPRAAPAELVAFDSCDAALEQFRAAALAEPAEQAEAQPDVRVHEAAPGGAPAAAPDVAAKEQHSGTNNHEAGVEEPDLLQTDGRRVVTVADGRLRVIDVASRRVTSTMDLPGGWAGELLLDGDRALVVGQRALTLVDLTGAARLVGTLAVDGEYVDARLVGGRARVVLRSQPKLPPVTPQAVRVTTIDDWLPAYDLTTAQGARSQGRLVDCENVYHPPEPGTSLLTVLTFELGGPLRTGDPVAIAADGTTVYGSAANLYVAHNAPQGTAIHQFDIASAGPARHVASGSVPGALLNQYSMSEHDGHLRVATMTGADNTVTVLARKGSTLTEVGTLGGLGRGERIYAVRFLGAVGYVVTFRQTDPLYTLDLADPARPRAVGELKITGYSAYLHPAGEGRLIGVGQEADLQGRALGLQVSLFDVGDGAKPVRLAQHRLSGGMAQVEADTHAFLYWPPTGLLVLPTDADALVLRVGDGSITALGRIGGGSPVLRSLVLGDELWTVSQSGVLVHDAATLNPIGSVPFA
ncbi:beta-propeller domain-containing protein [Prauserella flavalba]|uniref:beta-propeller domain-containing protein n=1 Tax=Prauserella flavalba TaxID=1477506 RepID=UPI0036E41AF3